MTDQRRIIPEIYQTVYREDFGKGYLALDILVVAAYVTNTIALVIFLALCRDQWVVAGQATGPRCRHGHQSAFHCRTWPDPTVVRRSHGLPA